MINLRKILYVEDESDIGQIAEMSLESIGGFEVLLCDSGQEALKQAEEFDPDMILLDVMMPGMDGPSTLLELRKIEKLNIKPIVFMTAKVQPREVEQLKALGAIDVIAKPFDPMLLADQVRKIWEKK